MKKPEKIKAFLASLCVALILVSLVGANAFAASIYERPQKHIYLVIDDSGSMDSDGRSDDSNYALQTLVAMTDKTDTITIYFLNQNSKIDGDLKLGNKSNSMLENIKVNYPAPNGGTPYNAVMKAQNDLRKAVSADDKGEYWLIVVTDGAFGTPKMDYEQDLMNFAQGKDANGKEAPLKNGDCPNVLCVTIACPSFISKENDKKISNLYTISDKDVIPSMNEAAKIISNRIEISNVSYNSTRDSVTFTVPYPARNIIVLTQNTKTNIVDYSCVSKLTTSENYNVSHPMPTKALDTSTVCFVTGENGKSISTGEVTFKFDKSLTPENTVILVEPAVGLSAQFYNQDGQKCDPSQLKIGEKAKLVYLICDPDTKAEIDENAIEGGVKYSATINGQTYDTNTIEFTVDSDELILDMYAEFEDGFVLDIHDEYKDLQENIVLGLTLSNGGNFSSDIYALDDSCYIVATPSLNGRALTADEIKNSTLSVEGGNFITARFEIEPDPDNGTFKIIPKGGIFKVLTPILTEVDVVFTSSYGQTITEKLSVELTGKRDWTLPIIVLIVLAVLIYLIVIYSIKPKFPLDLQLYSYKITSYRNPVNIRNTQCKPKSVFSPGVIDFWSALPWKHPFKIRLSAIDPAYEDIMLIATSGDMALVQNVKELTIEDRITRRKKVEPSYRILNSSQDMRSIRGYATTDALTGIKISPKKNEDFLVIKDNEFIQQHPKTNGVPKKLLRYVRKKTQKNNGEI